MRNGQVGPGVHRSDAQVCEPHQRGRGKGEFGSSGERVDLKCRRDLQAGRREGKGKRREREHNMEVPREDYDNEG